MPRGRKRIEIPENIEEKVAAVEAEIADLTAKVKAKKAELKKLVKAKEAALKAEAEKKAAEERDIENKELLDFVKESVGDRVAKVKLSDRLASRPCALTTEGGITLEMERYFRNGPSEEMRKVRATRVLELSPSHPAFAVLQNAFQTDDREKAAKLSKILTTLAEISAGCEIDDATEFVDLVSELF